MFTNVRSLMLLAFPLILLALSACETMEGAGRDIQHAGSAIEDTAD